MREADVVQALEVKDIVTTSVPIKVCIHIVKTSKNDVRAMRGARTLAEAGFAVTLIDIEDDITRPPEESIDGVCVKHIIMPGWLTSRYFEPWFFMKAVQVLMLSVYHLLQTSADIYHASELTALLAAFIAATLRRKPLIFEAYEHHLHTPETNVGFWRLPGGILLRFFRLLLPRCAGVISVSPPIVEDMRNRYHIPEVTLLRSVPLYRTVPKSDRLRQLLDLGPETRIALYQGGLQRNRGLDKLVQAASYLDSNVVIVMMGNSPGGSIQAELEALIAEEGVTDRVKMLAAVPYEELLDWTASADIGLTILPPDYSLSIRWCLPNKLFEYLMAGLPVLSSQLDAVAEVINTYGVGRVISSLAPLDIGAAINTMLQDSSALERMRHHALEAARNELNWEKESRQLIRLYQKILTKQGEKK